MVGVWGAPNSQAQIFRVQFLQSPLDGFPPYRPSSSTVNSLSFFVAHDGLHLGPGLKSMHEHIGKSSLFCLCLSTLPYNFIY